MNVLITSKRTVVAAIALTLSLTFIFGMLVGDVRDRIKEVTTERLVPIYKVDIPEKKIAITLDGFWGADKTPRLLDIFDKYNIKITFFFGGNWLESYPDMVKEINRRGHEIGNHSYTHPNCTGLTPDQLKGELRKTSDLIKNLTGKWPTYFRPPFGAYNNQVIRICEEENYQVIQWSIDSLDWKNPGVHFIVKRILDGVAPGEIILMHNDATHTPDALEILIPRLQQMGYKIVPLSEMVYKDNYYIERHSGVQKRVVR